MRWDWKRIARHFLKFDHVTFLLIPIFVLLGQATLALGFWTLALVYDVLEEIAPGLTAMFELVLDRKLFGEIREGSDGS